LLFDKIKVREAFALSSMLLSFSFAGFGLYISLRGYAIILAGNKKSTFDRASFLPAELIIFTPFFKAFLVHLFMDFGGLSKVICGCIFSKSPQKQSI